MFIDHVISYLVDLSITNHEYFLTQRIRYKGILTEHLRLHWKQLRVNALLVLGNPGPSDTYQGKNMGYIRYLLEECLNLNAVLRMTLS